MSSADTPATAQADTIAATSPPRAPVRVAVVGASGRMGSAACGWVEGAPDMELVARVGSGDDLVAALSRGVDVAVDLTLPGATQQVVATLVEAGVHAVVGATGWDEESLAAVAAQLGPHPRTGVLVAPNFALGAVLAMRFAEQAARWFESAEVVELHHPGKVDAPSGTARHTAAAIARGRAAANLGPMPDATTRSLPGARGAEVDGVPVHAVRLRGLVAHEEILLGNPGEVLTIRHDSLDLSCFAPGVLLAIRRVGGLPGLTVGLDALLDL